MNALDWAVTAAGAASIAAVNVYFFAPRRAAPAALRDADGVQEVRVRVRDGYDPAVIRLSAGRPARLLFRREEVQGCSDTVLLPAWKIARNLPAGIETAIDLDPVPPGEYEFTCGMHMLRGRIVVE